MWEQLRVALLRHVDYNSVCTLCDFKAATRVHVAEHIHLCCVSRGELTLSHHGHSYRHAHELALGPHVGVDAHPLLSTLAVKPGHRWMVGHLLRNKPDPVAASSRVLVVGVVSGGALVRSDQRFDFISRYFPRTVEGLSQHRVVGLLGHGSFPALVESGQVVLHEADDPVLSRGPGCDGQKHVGVGHEVGVHLQQRALFQNERGQHHLRRKPNIKLCTDSLEAESVPYPGQVHPQFELGQQVENDAPLVVQDPQILLLVVLRVRHLLTGTDVVQP